MRMADFKNMKRPQEVKAAIPKYADDFDNVMRGYERTLCLGSFADSGRPPNVTDVDVVVCFADLRGFTEYVHKLQKGSQDYKVQHFLRDYLRIYPRAVLAEIWNLEPDKLEEEMTAKNANLKKLVVPASYKNLGDGMMMVWELQSVQDMTIQGLATRHIFSIVEKIQKFLQELITKPGPVELDSYSQHSTQLKMGFGITRGHAWRLGFWDLTQPDYAGSVVNLAKRLQDIARPSGIVAQLSFSESKFRKLSNEGNGRITNLPPPKGLGPEPIEVWVSQTVILRKKLRKA